MAFECIDVEDRKVGLDQSESGVARDYLQGGAAVRAFRDRPIKSTAAATDNLLGIVLEVHVVPAQKAGQLALQRRCQVVVFSLHLVVGQPEKKAMGQNIRRARK